MEGEVGGAGCGAGSSVPPARGIIGLYGESAGMK